MCSPDHQLARRARVSLADLAGESIVALASQIGIRNALEAQSDLLAGLRSSAIEASSTLILTMLLKQNIGISIMPWPAAQLPTMGTLAFVPIADVHLRRDLYIIRRRRHSLSPAAEQLETEIRGAGALAPVS